MHSHMTIAAGAERCAHYYLGVIKGALSDYENAVQQTRETLTALRKEGAVEEQFRKCCAWWHEHLNIYQCSIPDAEAMRNINTWNPLQCVHTARYSRSISSSASGVRGIGFRDSAQDMLAQAYRKRSSWMFGIAGTLVGILGVAVLILDSVKNGIILLVIAFLVSPMGLPLAATWLLGLIQKLRFAIQGRVYG